MGAVPSTPRRTERPWDAAEHGIGAFVGDKSYPMSSEFWPKLLELPLTHQWPQHRVAQACQIFAQNNYQTRHLAKILIHMAWCLQECMMTSSGSSVNYTKAVNATYISSVFLKFVIENSKSETFEELYLSLNEAEAGDILPPGERIESYVMRVVLNFIGTSDANPHSSLHHELLNFMLVAVSTQLRSGPSPGPKDVHPFIDAAMVQDSTLNLTVEISLELAAGDSAISRVMAEHAEEPKGESLIEKIEEKFHGHDSSSSDSDNEKPKKSEEASSSLIKDKIWRLFGREKPVHKVLGGGKPADVFLWRNKKVSAGVLGVATAIWVLFELHEYHLLSLVCHCLILSLAVLFLWSNATTFINKSPPHIPEVSIPEDLTVQIALSLRYEINRGFAVLREIASGRDLKKFLIVIAGLWLLSVLGSCCNFLTLFYITFVLLHTVPVLYEKYEDQVDSFAEKATAEFKKHYAVFHAKCLSKVPRAPLKGKKLH